LFLNRDGIKKLKMIYTVEVNYESLNTVKDKMGIMKVSIP
jgi:hypothetical protein